MSLGRMVACMAETKGEPMSVLIDNGFVAWEARLIMHGYGDVCDKHELINFVNKLNDEKRNSIMSFQNYLGREFIKNDTNVVHQFFRLNYQVARTNQPATIEMVGELDEEGIIVAMRDADSVIAEILNGEFTEVGKEVPSVQ